MTEAKTFKIHLLPASYGDSILVEWGTQGQESYMLIDGGPFYAFKDVSNRLKELLPEGRGLDLLVITHIDNDHIDGAVRLLNQKSLFPIADVWFNGWEQLPKHDGDILGALQGEMLSALLKSRNLPQNLSFGSGPVAVPKTGELPERELNGLRISLLSPYYQGLRDLLPEWDKTLKEANMKPGDTEAQLERLAEDYRYADSDILGEADIEFLQKLSSPQDKSAANGSSIAMLIEYEGRSCLLSGDATTASLKQSIERMPLRNGRLSVDVWKLSHHGSRKSTQPELMQLIDCKKLLFSSDGTRYGHPDAETVAKLIKYNGPDLEMYFNYKSKVNEMWDDTKLQNKHKFTAYYPITSTSGITLNLLNDGND